MSRVAAKLSCREAMPVLEVYRGIKHTTTTVGTSAIALPATNLTNRKALFIQNLHASQNVFLGGAIPELIGAKVKDNPVEGATIKPGRWFQSAAGTNEWFFATSAKADPGLTQPTALYTAANAGAETLRTAGTVSSLAAQHGWGWGDGDTLGFSTLYIRTDGTTQETSPGSEYEAVISYFGMPDSSSTYGIRLGPYDGIVLSLDGSCRIFAIASGITTPVLTLEMV